jgi:hypothetical protein
MADVQVLIAQAGPLPIKATTSQAPSDANDVFRLTVQY